MNIDEQNIHFKKKLVNATNTLKSMQALYWVFIMTYF